MQRHRRLVTRVGALLGALCVLLAGTQVLASDRLTEEFHHSYPLASGGRVELENINGDVHITGWDQNEVKVDAVKYAGSKEQLDDAEIEVDTTSDMVSIRTKYHGHDHTFNRDGWHNPATVEYTLMVPRSTRLDEVELVNGSLDIHQVAGEVRASCVNGKLIAQGLQGRVSLETVNGRLEPQFDRLGESPIELSSVNGSVELTLPSDVKAELEASTVSGGISNDFGLHILNHHWVGHELKAELGGGGTRITLSNVNGKIDIRRANDGRALSPAKDLTARDTDEDDDEI